MRKIIVMILAAIIIVGILNPAAAALKSDKAVLTVKYDAPDGFILPVSVLISPVSEGEPYASMEDIAITLDATNGYVKQVELIPGDYALTVGISGDFTGTYPMISDEGVYSLIVSGDVYLARVKFINSEIEKKAIEDNVPTYISDDDLIDTDDEFPVEFIPVGTSTDSDSDVEDTNNRNDTEVAIGSDTDSDTLYITPAVSENTEQSGEETESAVSKLNVFPKDVLIRFLICIGLALVCVVVIIIKRKKDAKAMGNDDD